MTERAKENATRKLNPVAIAGALVELIPASLPIVNARTKPQPSGIIAASKGRAPSTPVTPIIRGPTNWALV